MKIAQQPPPRVVVSAEAVQTGPAKPSSAEATPQQQRGNAERVYVPPEIPADEAARERVAGDPITSDAVLMLLAAHTQVVVVNPRVRANPELRARLLATLAMQREYLAMSALRHGSTPPEVLRYLGQSGQLPWWAARDHATIMPNSMLQTLMRRGRQEEVHRRIVQELVRRAWGGRAAPPETSRFGDIVAPVLGHPKLPVAEPLEDFLRVRQDEVSTATAAMAYECRRWLDERPAAGPLQAVANTKLERALGTLVESVRLEGGEITFTSNEAIDGLTRAREAALAVQAHQTAVAHLEHLHRVTELLGSPQARTASGLQAGLLARNLALLDSTDREPAELAGDVAALGVAAQQLAGLLGDTVNRPLAQSLATLADEALLGRVTPAVVADLVRQLAGTPYEAAGRDETRRLVARAVRQAYGHLEARHSERVDLAAFEAVVGGLADAALRDDLDVLRRLTDFTKQVEEASIGAHYFTNTTLPADAGAAPRIAAVLDGEYNRWGADRTPMNYAGLANAPRAVQELALTWMARTTALEHIALGDPRTPPATRAVVWSSLSFQAAHDIAHNPVSSDELTLQAIDRHPGAAPVRQGALLSHPKTRQASNLGAGIAVRLAKPDVAFELRRQLVGHPMTPPELYAHLAAGVGVSPEDRQNMRTLLLQWAGVVPTGALMLATEGAPAKERARIIALLSERQRGVRASPAEASPYGAIVSQALGPAPKSTEQRSLAELLAVELRKTVKAQLADLDPAQSDLRARGEALLAQPQLSYDELQAMALAITADGEARTFVAQSIGRLVDAAEALRADIAAARSEVPRDAVPELEAQLTEAALVFPELDAVASQGKDILASPNAVARREDFTARVTQALERARTSATFRNEAAAQRKYGFVCRGIATVTAVKDAKGAITRWDVRFENQGAVPWAGTVAFVASGKNAGYGFESMGVPTRGAAALQPIFANKNYGVAPRAGEIVRLGVRGYASIELPLPADGRVTMPLMTFLLNGDKEDSKPRYFAADYVTNRREEKMATGKVMFFDSDRKLNQPPWYDGK